MIQFLAVVYDATVGEYIYSTPTNFTIATCTNTEKLSQLNLVNDGGTSTTIFDLVDFDDVGSGNGLNVATEIMYQAHRIFEETDEYHIIRVCTTWSKRDYVMEWSHESPYSVIITVDGSSVAIENVIPWDANQTAQDVLRTTSHMFTSVSTVDALLSQTPLWMGYFTTNASNLDILTVLSFNSVTVSVANSSYFAYGAGEYLGQSNAGTIFSKSYNGSAIVFWRNFIGTYSQYHGPVSMVPAVNIHSIVNDTDTRGSEIPGWDGKFTPGNNGNVERWVLVGDIWWGYRAQAYIMGAYTTPLPVHNATNGSTATVVEEVLDAAGVSYAYRHNQLGLYLLGIFESEDPDKEPDSDVDPIDIPPIDKPTEPIDPDTPDPYYDPTSDPKDPQYDPTKDPENPQYDPTEPHTPWRPPSTESTPTAPPLQPPQDVIEVPPAPPAFVTNNAMFTLYNPSGGDLNSLANFLWSPQWSIDTFKKIFANPLDCILGLMVMPLLPASTSTKEMAVGNIATGVTMRFFTNQFYDFDCGTFKIEEYYMSYLDYAPYTKISIYLPYIGDQQLNTDEVMNTTVGIKYRFDLATGDCVAFISIDGSVLYSFSGNCASRLPLAGNNWSGMLPALTMAAFRAGSVAAGVPALGAAAALAVTSMKQDISHTGSMSGSPGLMGIQTPYLIITRPRQALPLSQNSFTGYPSFITESLGSLSGYTEVEECHLEHVPCTGEELEEIERLLKEGVLF